MNGSWLDACKVDKITATAGCEVCEIDSFGRVENIPVGVYRATLASASPSTSTSLEVALNPVGSHACSACLSSQSCSSDSRSWNDHGGSVQVDPVFSQLSPRLLPGFATKNTSCFQTLLSAATCAITPRGGSLVAPRTGRAGKGWEDTLPL